MRSLTLLVTLASAILILYARQSSAIYCYACSSELDRNCRDPFNGTKMPNLDYQYGTNQGNNYGNSYGYPGNLGGGLYSLVNCDNSGSGTPFPYSSAARSVCKKQKKLVNGETTITRSCAWIMRDQAVGDCPPSSGPDHIRVEFCETCDESGCNSSDRVAAALLFPLFASLLSYLFLRH